MGLISKQLGKVAYVTATTVGAAQTLVTNATTLDTVVTAITMHNTDTVANTITICRVAASGGAVDTADINDEIWQQPIAASDTDVFDIPQPLNSPNDTIQVYTSIASKVNCWADGFTLPDQT